MNRSKEKTTKYNDKIQMIIEANLMKPDGCKMSDEGIVGFVMMGHNLFYDEALARVKQARQTIKIG